MRKHHRPTVADVMTRDVLSITEDTGFKDIVVALAARGVSGAPVVDTKGQVLGIVTESDLLRKEEFKSVHEDRRPFFETRRDRLVRAKSQGERADELMTTPVTTVDPDISIPAAARLMAERSVKRLPVIDYSGRLIGIVSRSDLLKVFLRPDETIRREIVDDVIVRVLWETPASVSVEVNEGRVILTGQIELKSMISFTGRLIAAVDGVVDVDNRLTYARDDSVPTHDPLSDRPVWPHR
ncbi:CBS domain-containing protein [Acrocarpospora macrocephala]|uniref:CBS domain-containing protein n=1 Tax=Acrocarpospora macrocephala TaxID=150177 RepID=A0A5M3WHN2_9ACTN|nr:CBS domain-containing protein [Acrocarpospora macrocephala]GES07729.1 hypothetical protein Amac_013240 [Acrocarpospora macrocephala]